MVRPPPNNQINNAANACEQPTQASLRDANATSGGGSTIPTQSMTTAGAVTSTITMPLGATASVPTMAVMSSSTAPSAQVVGGNPTLGSQYDQRSPIRRFPLNPQWGMPTTMMQGLHTHQAFTENQSGMFSPSTSVVGNQGAGVPQTLTNTSVLSLRQQMDESNHDMVNTLTQQLGTVINPLIHNTNDSYQMLTNQMSRIADFFGAPPIQQQPIRQIPVQAPVQEIQMPNNPVNPINQGQQQTVAQVEPIVQNVVEQDPGIVLVNRNQNADEVVRNIQQNHIEGQNNLAQMVETILAQNGFNTGLHRPNFVSALSEYVLETELPRGWKISKFTKFAGDINESTVEHIARYMSEAGNLANNVNLRMKYFPTSLTKNAFTWFTTLPPHSIHHWTQLERLFHEQFYMGQSKISLKELASVRRKTPESVDDYLNRFCLLKARCFTQVPEHELVEMAAGGLDYSIRKKLDTQHLRDMSQLADRVRQVERLKAEKARSSKFHKKEKIAYVETYESDGDFDHDYDCVENS
ncbi:hypothetical protein QL285_015894 [Trifolium repens]|nr:hypothetical protein QL285_015894 [Trifolium repens]